MKKLQILAAIVAVDFFALNAYAFYTSGLGGFGAFLANAGPWEFVLIADLLIALTVSVGWMWQDAARRGAPRPLGYTLVTALTGSLGVLFYVIARARRAPSSESTRREQPALA